MACSKCLHKRTYVMKVEKGKNPITGATHGLACVHPVTKKRKEVHAAETGKRKPNFLGRSVGNPESVPLWCPLGLNPSLDGEQERWPQLISK